ncbi:MAG: glycosyltransferase family 9 protein [Ignavibacteria bacterium]|nr:glycosyltransferase family 9 protein [Ignavibacteria bacterium]
MNILICRTDRIGDVVLTLPLAGEVKKHFRGCKVSFLAKEYTAPLVRMCTAIDEVLVLPEKNGRIDKSKFLNLILERKFDAVIMAYPRPELAWACFRARIPVRIGTAFRWYSFLFNKKIHDHRKEVRYHELEYNIRLLSAFDMNPEVSVTTVNYNILPTSKINLAEYNIPDLHGPILIIHPGSGGSAMDLPVAKMQMLTGMLCDHENITVLLTGSPSERELCETVKNNTRAINLAGKLNLTELIAVIGKCDIFVANSTGPLHIAAALGKYTVGFYPKIKVCSPERWAPYTQNRAVFVPPAACTNCSRQQCMETNCMDTIDINLVYTQIMNIANAK